MVYNAKILAIQFFTEKFANPALGYHLKYNLYSTESWYLFSESLLISSGIMGH
jgi:hypothetical protein